MSFKNKENNKVFISGKIDSEFQFDHKFRGEKFYRIYIKVRRKSEVADYIPIIVSERLIDINNNYTGEYVQVIGQFHSYNLKNDKKCNLILFVFAKEIYISSKDNQNNIYLDGYICKAPIYRKTPLGREISDVLVAVNRSYGKSDYIPCICWGINARFVGKLNVGTRIKIKGRIQSRLYKKRNSDDEFEIKTAYEISVSEMEVNENEN